MPPTEILKRRPSPAVVAQEAVRRFPRWALWLLCGLYVATGWMGREPWKSADIEGFALLFDVLGTSERAWWIARLGAASMLGVTLGCTWYSAYHLARRDAAQPVPFAFGGEARPIAYARAIADGAVLALMACMGLAQLSHETTSAAVQLCATSMLLLAFSSWHQHPKGAALLFVLGVAMWWWIWPNTGLNLGADQSHASLSQIAHMLVWFAWPVWILSLLTLFAWHHHWLSFKPSTHIALPLLVVLAHLCVIGFAPNSDRWFLSALPALSCLAAFALPTLRRSLKSLIDLFTLLFFTLCAFTIWVVWVAMQTGWPHQVSANVKRLAPQFEPSFSILAFLLACVASLMWVIFMAWRLGKHRPALWMSMVLPASGALLCWTLLMTLWLPLLDHSRSYKPLMQQISQIVSRSQDAGCLQQYGLNAAQRAAVRYYLDTPLIAASRKTECPWLLVVHDAVPSLGEQITLSEWSTPIVLRKPTVDDEDWWIYARNSKE